MLYDIDGQHCEPETPGFEPALARAHALRLRPRCLCQPGGVAMYVARTGGGHVLKRMPFTGKWHSASCLSSRSPLLVSAIQDDPETGTALLRLGFRMSRGAGGQPADTEANPGTSVTGSGGRLSLLGLLHYLWDEAELTHWRPQFKGRRSWGAVRRLLLRAAETKVCGGDWLDRRLYVPEPFTRIERDAIVARRQLQWAALVRKDSSWQRLLLCIAELKKLAPARRGFKAVLKHVPDHRFALEEHVYRRVVRLFQSELSLWSGVCDVRMIVAATFGLGDGETPQVVDLAMMPTTPQWLPISNSREYFQIDELVRADRSFVKCLNFKQSGVVFRPLPSSPTTGSRLIDLKAVLLRQ